MIEKLAREIKLKKGYPLVGIIGPSNPNKSYSSETGVKAGYEVRKFLENSSGKVFTGGVEGLGIDAYVGVLQYELSLLKEKGEIGDNKFFVLVPMNYMHSYGDFEGALSVKLPFSPPESYFDLSKLSKGKNLDIEYGGDDMGERRECLAHLADALVMVNGGYGTLDESLRSLRLSRPVIALENSGGAAEMLSIIKQGVDPLPKEKLDYDFDKSNIHVINDTQEIEGLLKKLL